VSPLATFRLNVMTNHVTHKRRIGERKRGGCKIPSLFAGQLGWISYFRALTRIVRAHHGKAYGVFDSLLLHASIHSLISSKLSFLSCIYTLWVAFLSGGSVYAKHRYEGRNRCEGRTGTSHDFMTLLGTKQKAAVRSWLCIAKR